MIKSKSKLKPNERFKNTFLAEDLVPLRDKLLNSIKRDFENQFALIHTINGKIHEEICEIRWS